MFGMNREDWKLVGMEFLGMVFTCFAIYAGIKLIMWDFSIDWLWVRVIIGFSALYAGVIWCLYDAVPDGFKWWRKK